MVPSEAMDSISIKKPIKLVFFQWL